MFERRFRSRFNLEQWARNQVDRFNRGAHDWGHIEELVKTIWRDGYRCGDADRCAELAERLLLNDVRGPEQPIEPWDGAERLQRARGY